MCSIRSFLPHLLCTSKHEKGRGGDSAKQFTEDVTALKIEEGSLFSQNSPLRSCEGAASHFQVLLVWASDKVEMMEKLREEYLSILGSIRDTFIRTKCPRDGWGSGSGSGGS